MKKTIGYLILMSPFVAIFIFCGIYIGWLKAILMYGAVGLVVLIIYVGVTLISD